MKGRTVLKRRIDSRTGSEGSHYDPYSFIEFTVAFNDDIYLIHEGLVEWVTKNGEKISFEDFEVLTGLTSHELHKYVNKPKICECGSKHGEWRSGFPGEELRICIKCGKVMDYSFDINAII